ncbi:hypothetical protein [Candidatus Magnetominusculus xianensis]|uniref:Secreted protein n=1 Tax=Candidatus Magnetominusculus xianensis TaxID=1748249 RepID=A0ABR5SHZ4_9BACT|nr:hypothetical protein [Candidatus Magnetominusculus xianensis]KWT91851.1 hypothetical protein ASN18_0753 [Candidatus Magnetominusculus xianensis]MBF0403906.1 hypothetical protein [Nitrospirota bacterium]
MNKVLRIAVIALLFSAIFPSWVCAADSSFTQQDRERLNRVEDRLSRVEDRLTRVEVRIDEGLKAVNQRMDDSSNALNRQMNDGFNALNHRMNDLYGLMYVLIAGMLTLVGFVLWDRRTTLAPVVRKNSELEEKTDKIEKVLKELALKDPNVAETMKHVGL